MLAVPKDTPAIVVERGTLGINYSGQFCGQTAHDTPAVVTTGGTGVSSGQSKSPERTPEVNATH